MTPSDAALMQRIQDRDSAAFSLLFERYQARLADHVWGVVRDPAAADDLAQEVFLRVWNRAHQWSGGSLQSKGVVSRIAPDDEMPALADGTPVALICARTGLCFPRKPVETCRLRVPRGIPGWPDR